MTASAFTAARRRGREGLFVVMSMGMAVVMVVTAMLVMGMVIIMMMVSVIMGMIVRGVAMRLALGRMCVSAFGIGAAFGIERRLDLDHARAEPLHHRLDDMIAPDTQAACRDL